MHSKGFSPSADINWNLLRKVFCDRMSDQVSLAYKWLRLLKTTFFLLTII